MHQGAAAEVCRCRNCTGALSGSGGRGDTGKGRAVRRARRAKPGPLFCLDGHPHWKAVHVQNVELNAYE